MRVWTSFMHRAAGQRTAAGRQANRTRRGEEDRRRSEAPRAAQRGATDSTAGADEILLLRRQNAARLWAQLFNSHDAASEARVPQLLCVLLCVMCLLACAVLLTSSSCCALCYSFD